MTRLPRHCTAVTVVTVALAGLFLAADMPAGVLLATTPALVCVGLHLAMDPGVRDPPLHRRTREAPHGAGSREADRPRLLHGRRRGRARPGGQGQSA